MGLYPSSPKALDTMEDANHIFEDFPVAKYAFYVVVYGIEIALTFWVACWLMK